MNNKNNRKGTVSLKDTSPIIGYGVIDRKGYLNGGKYGLVLFPTMQAAESHAYNSNLKPEPVTEQDVITLMNRLDKHYRGDVDCFVNVHYTNGGRFGETISFKIAGNDYYRDNDKIDHYPDGHASWSYACDTPKEAISALKSNALSCHFFGQNAQPVKKARKVKTDIPDFVEDTSIAAKGHDGMSL